MSYLPWISDEDLENCVREVLTSVENADEKANENLYKNKLDLFSAIFDISHQRIEFDDWIKQEKSRQIQKSLQNAIGYFHQRVLGHIKNSVDPGAGGRVDFINDDLKIVAEIKNKYNTMNSSSMAETYRKLEGFLDNPKYASFTAYCVYIIPKKSEDCDIPWNVSKMRIRENIRNIDGESFYKIVSGDENALENLVRVLPEIVAKISGYQISEGSRNEIRNLFLLTYK